MPEAHRANDAVSRALDMLLAILEAAEPVVSAAVLERVGAATAELLFAAQLLKADGFEATAVSADDHDDALRAALAGIDH